MKQECGGILGRMTELAEKKGKIMVAQGYSWRDSVVMLIGIGEKSKRQIPTGAKHADC